MFEMFGGEARSNAEEDGNHHAKAPAKHKSAKVAKKTAKRSKTAA